MTIKEKMRIIRLLMALICLNMHSGSATGKPVPGIYVSERTYIQISVSESKKELLIFQCMKNSPDTLIRARCRVKKTNVDKMTVENEWPGEKLRNSLVITESTPLNQDSTVITINLPKLKERFNIFMWYVSAHPRTGSVAKWIECKGTESFKIERYNHLSLYITKETEPFSTFSSPKGYNQGMRYFHILDKDGYGKANQNITIDFSSFDEDAFERFWLKDELIYYGKDYLIFRGHMYIRQMEER